MSMVLLRLVNLHIALFLLFVWGHEAMLLVPPPLASFKNIIFTSVSPKLVRANSEYSIFVTVEQGDKDVGFGHPPDTITFIAELVGIPNPKPDDNGGSPPLPIIPLEAITGANGRPTEVPTTTTPKPSPPVQNYTSDYVTLEVGSSGLLPIPVRQLSCCSQFNLTVTALTNTEHRYVEQGAVFRDTHTRSVLIQTDKPIYKPGDTVRYRIVVLDRNLVPVDSTDKQSGSSAGAEDHLSITINDSQGNVIRELKNEKAHGGLFSRSLELSTELNLGDWRITATVEEMTAADQTKKGYDEGDGDSGGGESYPEPDPFDDRSRTTASHSFTVDQYVLPKFKVDVKTYPSFVTYNSSKVRVQVDATYTYGKQLEGFTVVTLEEPFRVYYWPDPSDDGSGTPRKILKRTPITGTAFVEFDIMKEIVHAKPPLPSPSQPLRYEFQQLTFSIQVSVTDTSTGRVVNRTSSITIYEHAYKMELVSPPPSYKPGFPLTLTVKISTQDDLPVHDPAPDALLVRHGYKCGAQDGELHFAIRPSGIVSFTVITPTNELVGGPGLEVVYRGQTQTLYPPQKVFSASHSYMQVEVMTEAPGRGGSAGPKYAVGGPMKFRVRVNKQCSGGSIDYVLYGRGEILAEGKTKSTSYAPTNRGDATALQEHEFIIPALPPQAAPESTLVAYCVLTDSNEVLADSVKIRSDTQFQNHLAFKFTAGGGAAAFSADGDAASGNGNGTMEPGENATLQIESSQKSVVALRGVDQSVFMLKQDNDISAKTIDSEITKFQSQWGTYRVWGGSPAFQVFEEAGLLVLTNGVMERQNWNQPWYPRRRFGGGGRGRGFGMAFMAKAAPMMMAENANVEFSSVMPMAFDEARAGGEASGFAPPVRVRQHFPEAWLWEEICMNESASVLHYSAVPDTITSWYISGYSLHPETGIALSGSPTIVTVFRPFFVTLNVPHSVVKGEMLALQVLVHNYMENDADADVTLSNVDNSLAFNEHANESLEHDTKTVPVPSGSVASVLFAVTPIKFGTIKLSVRGTTLAAGDAIEQPLLVKPPGHKLIRTAALLVDLKDSPSFDGTLVATFPHGREPGADELRVSVVGDLLGATMKHLDRLLVMPVGCGEQNMLNFVPDIVVLEYLNETGGLSNETRGRAIRYLEQGYQRELTYRHYDGSFSAFGQSDPQGSTWLTAFVIKSFVQASTYITVDQNTVVQGLQYLVAQQHKSGSFIELGHVLHAEMQGGGGPGNELALTAYVLLAFIEARNSSELVKTRHDIKFDAVIEKGVGYILESYPVAKNDSYTVSLITYVLTLLQDPRADEFFNDLQSLVIKDSNALHWDSAPKPYPLPLPDIDPEPMPMPFVIYHPNTRPVAVEITSYALMTYLARGDLMTGLSIARWLLQQRNAMGGFISTQDTVVGLTALARFAAATRSADTDMEVKVSRGNNGNDNGDGQNENGGGGVVESCKVDSGNQIVLQEFKLAINSSGGSAASPSSGAELNDTVSVHAQGKGTALAVLTWTYYMEEHDQKPAFNVEVNVEPTANNSGISLYICSRFLAGARSNMIVQEVNLPSGYMFEQEDVKPLTKKVAKLKRVDLEQVGTQLQLYYDYFLGNGTECITLAAARVFRVANPSRAYVHVYDYYDTTLSAVTYYEPLELAPCDLCTNEVDGGGGNRNGNCKIQNC